MQMISLLFFLLVAVVFLVIYLLNRFLADKVRLVSVTKWVLLISSYLFVAYADYRFALVLGILTIVVWLCSRNQKYTKVGILAAVLALAYFKYTNFFVDSFARLLGHSDFNALNIFVPLGISFYTFSAISYLVDVGQGKAESRPLLDVAVYLSFFPKFTSGPIQKCEDFFTQLDKPRQVGWLSFSEGIQIFCFGLFKKMVLADRLAVFVNQVFATPLAFGSGTVLLAVLSYSLQIYFDFSGYSDMAIGVARMLDIHLPRNFNLPYLSHNVTELWKRWHITLSGWIQEYLYIPLGGNRKGQIRACINLVLTMVIGGLWHGASWGFVLWGLLHGLALVAHKLWVKWTGANQKPRKWLPGLLSVLLTFCFTSFCWIFFRAETLSQAFAVLSQIFSLRSGISHPYRWTFVSLAILVGCSIFCAVATKNRTLPEHRQNTSFVEGFYPLLDLTKFWHLVLFFLFCGLLLGLAYTGSSPFIYGEF